MKFDLDVAWRDTTRMAADNGGLLSAIAGIFVFLPYATLLLALPVIATVPELPQGASFTAALAAFEAFYAQSWWAFILAGLVVTIGLLAMIALLGRRDSPTVGDAIALGLKAIIPAWLTLFLQNMGINLVVLAIAAVATASGLAALSIVATLLAIAAAFYLSARLSLVLPIIAVDGEYNPFRILTASWSLTKGHGSRLLLYYALLAAAGFVVLAVLMLLVGAGLALAGPSVEEAGGALVSAAAMTAIMMLVAAVLAAVHRQLRRNATGGPTVPQAGGS